MARRAGKKHKKHSVNTLSVSESRKLWTNHPVDVWLQFFQEIAPEQKWQKANASELVCICPYHPDKNPSFHISFGRRLARGFSCGHREMDIIKVVKKLLNSSYEEALLAVVNRFNISEEFGKYADHLVEFQQVQDMKKAVAVAMKKVTDEAIRDRPAHLQYCFPTLCCLCSGRGLSLSSIHALPISIFPKPEHTKGYLEEKYWEMFETYFSNYLDPVKGTKYWGSVCFHYNMSTDIIFNTCTKSNL